MPPKAQYQTLNNGYTLHYIDEGASDASQVVVFIHGSGAGASGYSNFKTNYPYLVHHQCRVIVVDLIGYGYSDKPDNVDYHLDFFVHCLDLLLQALKLKKYVLLGNSLGGAIALAYTLKHAERVKGLILMAPGGIEEQQAYFEMPAMAIMKSTFGEQKSRESLKQFICQGLVHPSNQHLVDDALLDERWEISLLQNEQVIKTMRVPNMSAELHRISCPVLAFWGVDEKMMPARGIQTLSNELINIKLVLVSRCGHWVMLEHSQLFNRYCLDFIQHLEDY